MSIFTDLLPGRAILASLLGELQDAVSQSTYNVKAPSFKAKGDGTTDDTDALQDAADAASGGAAAANPPASPLRTPVGRYYMPPGNYRITSPITFKALRGLQIQGAGKHITNILVDGTLDSAFILQGAAWLDMSSFSISGLDGQNDIATDVIAWDWDNTASASSSYQCVFHDIGIDTIKFVNGIAIGKNSGARQVDMGSFRDIYISGNHEVNDAADGYYESAFLVGSGTSGNILGHHFINCHPLYVRKGYYINNVNPVSISMGDATHVEDLVYKVGAGLVRVSDYRIEESNTVLNSLGGSTVGSSATLDNIVWTGSRALDDYFIKWQYSGTLDIHNMHVQVGPAVKNPQKIYLNAATYPITVNIDGWIGQFDTNYEDDLFVAAGATKAVITTNGLVNQPNNSESLNAAREPRHWALGAGHNYHIDSPVKLLVEAGIGVGNSASATTPGSCVKKIQVFDENGNSLGYLAVYSAIT